MSDPRKERLKDLKEKTGCPVKFVDASMVDSFILPDHPFHPAYKYLHETHKADYLRTYFMNFYGGGYADIKSPSGDWNKAFADLNSHKDMYINSYHEPARDGVAGDDSVKDHWKELPGNCAYIMRPNTPFTQEWYRRLHATLDEKLEALKAHAEKNPPNYSSEEAGYPVKWSEILGNIYHALAVDYRDKILFTVPTPIFVNYR